MDGWMLLVTPQRHAQKATVAGGVFFLLLLTRIPAGGVVSSIPARTVGCGTGRVSPSSRGVGRGGSVINV